MIGPAPHISIITVCFNANDHIRACLESVAAQTYRPIEHIVVDGGSTDGTIEAVKAAPHVSIFVSEKDDGIYDAMNKGVARATGELLIFLNADDRFAAPDTLTAAAAEIAGRPDGDVYYGSLDIRRGDGSSVVYRPDPPEMAAQIMICGCLPHQSTFARRRVFELTDGFDTSYRYHADYDWFLKVIHHPAIRLVQIETVVGSFSEGGVSSQLERTQPEVHRIQNASPVYASPEWNRRRIETYQNAYLAERLEVARLRAELAKQSEKKVGLLHFLTRPFDRS